MKLWSSLLAAGLGALLGALPAAALDKKTVGWVERVVLQPGNVHLQAKLDTGAEYSSLDATQITKFSRDRRDWVRFAVNDRHGKKIIMERPLLRQATIKRHFARSQTRPVITLRVCIGGVSADTEVNLVDRTGFLYPMLIGRKFMEGRLIIDPAARLTVEPHCPEQPASE